MLFNLPDQALFFFIARNANLRSDHVANGLEVRRTDAVELRPLMLEIGVGPEFKIGAQNPQEFWKVKVSAGRPALGGELKKTRPQLRSIFNAVSDDKSGAKINALALSIFRKRQNTNSRDETCRSDGIRRRLVKAFKQFSLRGRYLAVIINTFNEAFRGRACCLLLDVQPIVQCCVVNSADDQAKKIRLTIGVSARACTVLLPSILDEFFIKTCRCEVPVAFYRHRASYSDISALHYQEKVIKSVSRFARLEMQLCDRTEFGLKRKFSAEDLREKPSGNLIGKCKATTTGGLCGCSFFSHCLSALILRYLSTKPG